MKKTDIRSVGESIHTANADWNFKGSVAKTFSNHVQRSVPMYDVGHDLVCKISDFFLIEDSICYELGVSTGQLIHKLAHHNQHKKVRFVGIDIEEEMITQARQEIDPLPFECQ